MRAVSVKPNQVDSLLSNKYVVVDGVKSCRNIEEAETRKIGLNPEESRVSKTEPGIQSFK